MTRVPYSSAAVPRAGSSRPSVPTWALPRPSIPQVQTVLRSLLMVLPLAMLSPSHAGAALGQGLLAVSCGVLAAAWMAVRRP